ncbi:MAG: hypothetical protein GF331_07790, partial [Chitinivibrionales bacterium]|nr:hypothetical protein [Chitinivibrionales bacterium]
MTASFSLRRLSVYGLSGRQYPAFLFCRLDCSENTHPCGAIFPQLAETIAKLHLNPVIGTRQSRMMHPRIRPVDADHNGPARRGDISLSYGRIPTKLFFGAYTIAEDTHTLFEQATSYTGSKLREIAFPLGGIGTGTVSLTGNGGLAEWQVRNRPDQDTINEHTFFSIWAREGNASPVARVLEGPVPPPFSRHQRSVHGGFFPGGGLGNAGVPGLPRLEATTFHGAYPLAAIDYHDSQLPVAVRLVAYNPMIP